MRIHISPSNGVPIYMQIVSQVKALVASGQLAVNDELPPIRALAEQLLINPNTVARAYRDLEQAGVLTSNRGAGTRITDAGSPLARKERIRLITERIDGLLTEAHHLEIDLEQLVALVRKRFETFRPATEEQ